MISYFICGTARCGSSLLSRALSDTGIAGHPDEWFLTGPSDAFPPGTTHWEDGPLARYYGVIGREEYLRLVQRVGSTPNGVFGVKIMWTYFEYVMKRFHEMSRFARVSDEMIIKSTFPGLHIVHLVRNDRLRQAISWLRAVQDGVWLVSEHEPARPLAEPCFDYDVLAGMMDLIEEGEQGWLDLYKRLDIDPYVVVYEDLMTTEGYEHTVRSVLAYLDLDDTIEVPSPRAWRQADSINDEWVQQFQDWRTS